MAILPRSKHGQKASQYRNVISSVLHHLPNIPLFCSSSSFPDLVPEFSPDGKTLAVGNNQWVEIWDLERSASYIRMSRMSVRCGVSRSSDGETLYTSSGLASRSGEIRVLGVSSEELIKNFEIHGDTIESISLSPRNTTLITASMDEYSAVIDLTRLEDTDFRIVHRYPNGSQHVGRVLCTLYHPEGAYFVTGSEDKTVKVWDPITCTVLVNLDANDDAVYSLAYSAEEDVIVSGSADNTVRTCVLHRQERAIEVPGANSLEMTGALVL